MEITTEKDIILWADQVLRYHNTGDQRTQLHEYGLLLEVWVTKTDLGYGYTSFQVKQFDLSQTVIFSKTCTRQAPI